MSSRTLRGHRIRLACALACAALVGACSRSKADAKPAAQSAPEALHVIAEFSGKLARIHAAVARVAEEKPCPDATAGRETLGSALVVDDAVLERLTRPGNAPNPSRSEFWKGLTSAALRTLPAPGQLRSAEAARNAQYSIVKLRRGHKHIAVVRAVERVAPSLHGDQFVSGRLDAWLALFELDTARLVCATRFTASNSDQVAGHAAQDRAQALRRDFVMNLRQQLDRAASRLSPSLVLEHD